jgi:protein-tyrosine-phosphatase
MTNTTARTIQRTERRTTSRRILTVCLGNHCRSPIAAVILAERGGDAVETCSAGLRDKWAGKAAHQDIIRAAAERGYDLGEHRGIQVSTELMAWADLILAMDYSTLEALRELANERTLPKLALYLGDQDVPDPWGQTYEAFIACVALVESGARRYLPV